MSEDLTKNRDLSGQPPAPPSFVTDALGRSPVYNPDKHASNNPWFSIQAPTGPRPSPHWVLSILGLTFFWFVGIFAIYFSAQVGRRWDRGDFAGSINASKTAKVLGIISLGLFFATIFFALAVG